MIPLRSVLILCLALAPAVAAPRPRLVVVISVDQLAEGLLEQWGPGLPGGLGRLYREGCTFRNAYQAHGATETGPGHSTLLTGRHPMHTGIAANQWREAAGAVYCVGDPAHPVLGAPAGGAGAGPRFLAGTTLGGWLHQQVPGSRMFAVSGKDRSAILMAGAQAEGVYWFAGPAGFTTSTAYAGTLPSWLRAGNQGLLERLAREPLAWTALEGQAQPPSATFAVAGRRVTFGLPRSIRAAGAALDDGFWDRYRASPFLDQATLGAALALADGEGLGSGPGVDVLALGLSATDYVGHAFGNAGPEMADHLRRLDQALGRFLAQLAARVPGVWVVLTADHGAADLPERRQAQGLPGQRVEPRAWQAGLERQLRLALGGARPYFLPMTGDQLYLDPDAVRASGHSRAEVLAAAAGAARATPEVEAAFSAEALAAFQPEPGPPDRTSLETRVRLSFVAGRSGDLLVVFKPYTTLGAGVAGHGSPHDYDRKVPLVFWGPWRAETREEPVSTVDLAPTLALELGIRTGEPVDGAPLKLTPRTPPLTGS